MRRFIEEDDPKGLRPDMVKRIRNILAAMISASDVDGISGPPGWRLHQLTGDRAGSWSIATSGNWRITFSLDEGEIVDLDLEDYH